jgi:Arc/MetJ family transcription regulator
LFYIILVIGHYIRSDVYMRAVLVLDDDLLRLAQEFTGVKEKTVLVREALKALIERESARRLAALGRAMPQMKDIPRRRGSSE